MAYFSRIAFLAAALVSAAALGAGTSTAQPRRDDGAGVVVYDDVNFQGPALTLRNDVNDMREYRLNDRISSLQMAPGERWEVCENTNFGGRCEVISGSERDLRPRGWNDMISSMRRVRERDDRRSRDDRNDRGRASITVYDDVNFQGKPFTFRGDVADMRQFGLNDRISSLQVGSGESWEICENTGFGGQCTVVSGSERDLRRINWNDMISSMHPVSDRDGRRDRDRDNRRDDDRNDRRNR
ncbi:MAG: beta/gamma crystallin-related protein [Acidobacteriota bacterium]